MLGAQRLKQQFFLRYLSNRKFGASVIVDNKYACNACINTCIETDKIMFLKNMGPSWSAKHCATICCHSKVPTMGLLSCMGRMTGRQRLLEQPSGNSYSIHV